MSIITTYPAVPSRLLSIYAAAYDATDGESRELLEAFSTPASLATRGAGDEEESGSSLFVSAFQEARRLKLIEENQGRIRIASPATEGNKRKRIGPEEAFRTAVSAVLFNPDLAQETEHSAFMLATAWLLGKNPLQPLNFSEPPQEMLREDLGDHRDKTELTNISRYQNFLYWARYLGFACFVGFETGRRVIPDPTRAIQSALPRIFDDQQALDIEPFLSSLNQVFPVFEGGTVWAELEAMRPQSANSDNTLSIATSLALRRLAERGVIRLESIADARGRILQFGIDTDRVSRIRRGEVQ